MQLKSDCSGAVSPPTPSSSFTSLPQHTSLRSLNDHVYSMRLALHVVYICGWTDIRKEKNTTILPTFWLW